MYRIMDLDGANLVGDFRSEEQALRYICDAIARNGRASVRTLALARIGEGHTIARGLSLAKMALERFPSAKRSA